MQQPNRLFSSGDLSASLQSSEAKLKAAAEAIPAQHALGRSPEELAAELLDHFRLEPLSVDWDARTASTDDATIDVTDSWRYAIDPDLGRVRVTGTRLTLHIPFKGAAGLFELRPSHFTLNPPFGLVGANELRLVAEAPADQREGLIGRLDSEMASIKTYVERANADVEAFNRRLADLAREAVERRRQKVIADRDLVASLGVPIRMREDAAPTYAVAPVKRRAVAAITSASYRASKTEPVMTAEIYEEVLRICRNMSAVLERSPAAFATLDEEAIRTQFLVPLNGLFEGGATAETFSFKGKTDIMLIVDGHVVFIAECKFWDGPAKLLETVDQILRYLTWRDSKAAILLYNRDRQLSTVLEAIGPTIAGHPNLVREVTYGGETDFRFVLRHTDDPEREVTLSVLVFEVPRPA